MTIDSSMFSCGDETGAYDGVAFPLRKPPSTLEDTQ